MMLETSKVFNKRVLIRLLCIGIALAVFFPFNFSVYGAPTLKEKFGLGEQPTGDVGTITKNFTDYGIDTLKDYKEKNYTSPNTDPIVLEPGNAVGKDGAEPKISSSFGDRTEPALVWDDRALSYEWKFDVAVSGLYEIFIEYRPIEGEVSEIQRRLLVNGKLPFRQVDNVFLNRKWGEKFEEKDKKPKKDLNGDEKAPRLEQIYEWNVTPVNDSKAMYSRPLKFYFEQGANSITLEYVNAPVSLGNITIKPAQELPSYEEYKKSHSAKEYKGKPITLEAEKAAFRSAQVLRRSYDSDPTTFPEPKGNVVQNVIGNGWNTGNKDITWVVEVPESGYYKLAFRTLQNSNIGLSSYRQIMINGEVPFEEVDSFPFQYEDRWITREVAEKADKPYLFYLEAGKKNEITLRIKTGDYTSIINETEALNFLLTDIIKEITKITSTSPDPNFNYKLEKNAPWIIKDLKKLSKSLKAQADYLLKISSKRPSQVNTLLTAAEEIDTLVKHPIRIPVKLPDLQTMQKTLSDIFTGLQNQPLMIDYVELLAADEKPEDDKASFWQKLVVTFRNFILSFTKDYDNIATDKKVEGEGKKVIDVWVAREKQWAELIQQLTDEEFSRDNDIYVNINILPSGSAAGSGTSPLMLSIISGKAPDVALGSDGATPVELAIRQASYDLSQFDDFEEVSKRFLPGHLTPFQYEGGTYALPETMDIPLMFYRTDIIDELGITLPNTWDDLFQKTLPIIRQSGAHMLMPADFTMFLFQNGGEMYKDDNRKSALDSDAAYKAFVNWTEAYTVYRMTASADLLQHFRNGTIPIFVGGVGSYITVTHAAPEIYGRWNIMPIPGTLQDDGSINRTAGSGVNSVLMFEQTKNPDEAWEYLKWWTSAEIQSKFSSEIESIVGPTGRWITANIEAFESMSWDANHLAVMKESMKWVKNVPNVLGGYYTGRSINNAWTRTVLGNMDPRDSLEQAIKEINRELERKNDEYDKLYS